MDIVIIILANNWSYCHIVTEFIIITLIFILEDQARLVASSHWRLQCDERWLWEQQGDDDDDDVDDNDDNDDDDDDDGFNIEYGDQKFFYE